MQIKIRNLGPVKEFDFDLKDDFAVVFGKNNMGKSYALSVVYLIIKNIKESYLDLPGGTAYHETAMLMSENANALYEKLTKGFHKEINIKEDMEALLSYIAEYALANNLHESFCATFDEIDKMQNRYSQDGMFISLHGKSLQINLQITGGRLCIAGIRILTKSVLARQPESGKSIEYAEDEAVLYLPENQIDFNMVVKQFVFKSWRVFIQEADSQVRQAYYIPASRSGLYQGLSAFSQIFAELSKNRALLNKKVEIPKLPETVSDYFLELSSMETIETDNEVLGAANEIEQRILRGEILLDNKTKEISYKPYRMQLDLSLSATSSMVAEISPIVSYLKYIIASSKEHENAKTSSQSSKPLIFIEEPEAHLHPEMQVCLMEIFAKLIKANVKIVFTSHSNYMFNKMNNLILDNQIDTDSTKVLVLHETDMGSVAKNIPMDELGMDDENFLDVAEALFNEKLELIDKLNKDV